MDKLTGIDTSVILTSDTQDKAYLDKMESLKKMDVCTHCFFNGHGYIVLLNGIYCLRCKNNTEENKVEQIEVSYKCPNCEGVSYNQDDPHYCSDYCKKGGPETSCWGCREEQPNQLAHMDRGGCLYNPDDHSDQENY